MHFNKLLLKSIIGEGLHWLSGKYIPYSFLLRQIRWTNIAIKLLLGLFVFSLWCIGWLHYAICQDTALNKQYHSLTFIDIYNSNYESFIKTLNPHTLFLFAFLVQMIKLFFTLLILLLPVYLVKFRQAWSLYLRKDVVEKWRLMEKEMKKLILHIALNPFPDLAYDKLQKRSLPDNICPLDTEQIMNGLFGKEEFPKVNEFNSIVVTKHLSFMYHDDFSWDKWLHYIWKKYFPSTYKRHLISSNTLSRSQEEEREDPRVLRGVSVSISTGKFTTILGCNGSGKSAFIKTIMHLLERYQGKVFWIGRDLKRISPKSFYRNVAYVDQNNIIHNDISVYDYVACGLFPSYKFFKLNYAGEEERIRSSLEKMEMFHHKDRSMRSLSGGERQRAILSRALAQNTDVIILDEPTTYLDINAQYKILNLLKKIQTEENKTVIAVLHDIQQAQQFSDEIILMDIGKVYAYGPVQDIINKRNMEKVFDVPWN